MTTLKALITTLVLGTSSVAMAKPASFSVNANATLSWNTNRPAPVVVRDHRPVVVAPADDCNAPDTYFKAVRYVPAPAYNPNNTTLGADSSSYVGAKPWLASSFAVGEYYPRWVALTEPTRIDRGREFITIGSGAGRFSQIRLQNTAGSSHILQVAIEFNSGRTQVVKLDKDLTSRSSLTIDLDGGKRYINRIVVYGSTGYSSAYQILAL